MVRNTLVPTGLRWPQERLRTPVGVASGAWPPGRGLRTAPLCGEEGAFPHACCAHLAGCLPARLGPHLGCSRGGGGEALACRRSQAWFGSGVTV